MSCNHSLIIRGCVSKISTKRLRCPIQPLLLFTSGKAKRRHGKMPTGTVKWFNTTKGFGFIAPETGGGDVFVHISAVERSGLTGLADDQKVSYELEEGRDGRQMAGDLKSL
jgi:CspA family cold shock protein